LCTGALAAAAVSCSRHVSDLLKLAPHAVAIAFRAALRAYEAGQSIERGAESWSLAVTNAPEDEIRNTITDFSAEKVR
jgi:hypothetical protein